MQQNSAEILTKLSRSPENVIQREQFTRARNNPIFAITPESLGMNVGSDTPTPTNEQQQQQPQPESPLAAVKSNERHNKPSMEIPPDCKRIESNLTFTNCRRNVPTNSHTSVSQHCLCSPNNKTEFMAAQQQQQWNFELPKGNENTQLNLKYATGGQSPISPNAAIHINCAHLQNVTSLSEIPTLCLEQHLEKYTSDPDACVDDAARLNFKKINDLYCKRIEDIDENVWGDKDLKIFTYQEWVELLTKIGESFINNMEELEREVAARLELVQKRVNTNCRHSQENEALKYRKDVVTLVKYIRNAGSYKRYDLEDLKLETISSEQLAEMMEVEHLTMEEHVGDDGNKNYNEADVVQKNKLYANMKALAHEVAEKHDEVRELKRQVICLEDEIQNAQKKIQLKDDVIKELRNDLKCAKNKISSNTALDAPLVMPPVNFENQTSHSGNTAITENSTNTKYQDENGSQFDSFSHIELAEEKAIKILDDELEGFFELNHDLNKQKMDLQRKRIMAIIERQESEKDAAYRKLDFIRNQLIDLESDSVDLNNDSDSGFHSKSENEKDVKLLDAVRKRLRKLNDMNCELKKIIQKLVYEKNELANNLLTDKSFSERNDLILKEIADLLCNISGKQFSYTGAYNTASNQTNPFCAAIMELHNNYEDKESKLLLALGRGKQQNDKLSRLLLQNEKGFNEERETRLNLNNFEDIDNTPVTLLQSARRATPSQTALTLSTSLTGQEVDSTTTESLHRLVDK